MTVNAGFIPDRVIAGETIWIAAANTVQSGQDIILTDYSPAGGDSLVYQFSADTPISVTAIPNGDDSGWTLEVTGAQTLLWDAGDIRFVGLVTDSDSRSFAIDSGTIEVTASPMATSDYAAALTAIEAAISDYASNPHGSFTLDGMQVTYRALKDLLGLRAFYRAQVARETGKRTKRIIRTRFT